MRHQTRRPRRRSPTARQPAARGSLPQPRTELARLQRPGARARRGPVAAAAGARQVPGDLRLESRRVLHGAGRRPQAPRRDGTVGPLRRRPVAARTTAPHRRAHPADRAAATRTSSSTRCGPRWPTRASSSSPGPISTTTNAGGCPTYFHEQVFPVLTPLAVDPAHPFPFVSGLSLNLAVTVKDPDDGGEHFARIKVPDNVDRFVELSSREDDSRAWCASCRWRSSSPRSWRCCSPAWRSSSTTPSGSPATPTSRSKRTATRICCRPWSASWPAAASAPRCGSRSPTT